MIFQASRMVSARSRFPSAVRWVPSRVSSFPLCPGWRAHSFRKAASNGTSRQWHWSAASRAAMQYGARTSPCSKYAWPSKNAAGVQIEILRMSLNFAKWHIQTRLQRYASTLTVGSSAQQPLPTAASLAPRKIISASGLRSITSL